MRKKTLAALAFCLLWTSSAFAQATPIAWLDGMTLNVVSLDDPLPVTINAPFYTTSLNAVATDETKGDAVGVLDMARVREVGVYVDWSSGVTSGEVCVESASSVEYTGEWAVILPCVTFSGTAPKQDLFQVTGYHRALRTRVNTAVANGTVTTTIGGN